MLKSASNSGAKGSLPTSINDDSRYVTAPHEIAAMFNLHFSSIADTVFADHEAGIQHQDQKHHNEEILETCLLYTSPSPRDQRGSRMPSSA